MDNPYKIYENNLPALRQFAKEMMDGVVQYALGGKKPDWMIKDDKFKKEYRAVWDNIKLNNCCHCRETPTLIEDIDCGIDGGPSPCTVHGLKIKCNCGMSTEIYNYRGDDEKLVAYTKCSIEWNKLK